jgi:Peptidase M66
MRPIRLAGLLGRAVGLIIGLTFLAGGSWPVVQAGSPLSYQLLLPLLLRPPQPIFLPLLTRGLPPPVVDLSVSRIEIIQGITMAEAYTVQVANRPALVRVFVGLTGAGSQAGVTGRLTRYVGGNAQDSLDAGPLAVLGSTSESSLAETLNFNLPANWLSAGTAYVLQLDPGNTIRETNEANNRYPPDGQASFNFQDAPTLDIVVVPVHYARPGAPATDPPTADLSYVTWMPIQVYPLSRINYTLHSSITFSGDLRASDGSGWEQLLNQITDVHVQGDPGEHDVYYGLVDSVGADGCGGGCIAGIGWINQPPLSHGYLSKSAVGFAGFAGNRNEASPIMTHEIGHTFGRYHSPCGTTSALGPYPYPNASLGQWGYDNGAGQLLDPNVYRDYMSYCDPAWTSDFTYRAVFDAWSWVSNPFGAASLPQAGITDAWVVSGSFDQTDHWQVSPAHVQPVPQASRAGSGPLRLDMVDGTGRVLQSQSFASVSVALDLFRTGFYQQGFRVSLPVMPAAAGFRIYRSNQLLYERSVTGPAPRLANTAQTSVSAAGKRIGWSLAAGPASATYNIRVSWDGGQTWQVLAIDQAEPSISLPPAAVKRGPPTLVEVQASDGVRTDTRTYSMPAP